MGLSFKRCGLWSAVTLVLATAISPAASAEQAAPAMPTRGIVRPLHQAAISIDFSVRVAKLHVREAQGFKKGDVLVTFDCERLSAEHDSLLAVYREMSLMLESNRYLDRRGAVGKVDVAVSRARVAKAKADAKALAARLKQCKVVAPFSGRVSELRVNEHEIPATGQPFITLVDESQFEIDLIVPSVWLRTLRTGAPLVFAIDETGVSYGARVARIGASVDAVSQTIKIIAVFSGDHQGVLAGMSGSARFDVQKVR
ncbi:MAG: efflux RND transporter periplasmic adaptor subunit [Hyphomicrobiaceae bacterium]|nr:efflux RND transporter periplasmic adaptor subunit [Hyphomicrobiaceae bacterium]